MRRLLIAGALFGAVLGASLIGVVVSGAFSSDSNEEPSEAKTADAIQTMVIGTREALPHATVDPNYTPPLTCPSDFPATGVKQRSPNDVGQPPPDFKADVTSTAFAVGSNGIGYEFAAGRLDSSDDRWYIRARDVYSDPCQAMWSSGGKSPASHLYEAEPGPITLTDIQGDLIFFNDGAGDVGYLDFVSGELVPPANTPVPTLSTTIPTIGQATSQSP